MEEIFRVNGKTYSPASGAYHSDQRWKSLEAGDVEAALQTAAAIGDDRLQRRSQGYVVPDAFTHGAQSRPERRQILSLRVSIWADQGRRPLNSRAMKRTAPRRFACLLFAASFALAAAFTNRVACAQQSVSTLSARTDQKTPPLTLRTRIALPGVYGRIDHYGLDSKRGVLLVTALGNNSIEIVDQWKRVGAITGLEHPQASIYLPGIDRIVVSSQSGKLRFYDAESHSLVKTLDFGDSADTDNMRYDSVSKILYVGYGKGQNGALAAVDPVKMERLREYKLGSHPESFQLEHNGPRIFVNLPDQAAFGVIDRNSAAVTNWMIAGNQNSHTLAFDEKNHRLFAAALQPGRLTVVDSDSGNIAVSLPCVLGVDDLWFDAARKRIYAGGSGAIDVFQQDDADHYTVIANIIVGAGAGSTSLYFKSRTQDGLYMSWPNMLPQGGSEVLLYYVND
jgi:putative neutral zinc metallopeptidase